MSTYYVSPSGSDSNDGSSAHPFLTIQHAVDVCLPFTQNVINLADGTYSAGANIARYKDISISGNTASPGNVVINVAAGATGLWVQDISIGILSGFTLNGGNGSIGIMGRQFSIVDYSAIRFGAFPNGGHVQATEKSKMNAGGEIEIFGGAVYHVDASNQSQVIVAAHLTLTGTPAFTLFYDASNYSLIDASTTTYSGTATGTQYILDDALLRLNPSATVPGNASGQTYHDGQAF